MAAIRCPHCGSPIKVRGNRWECGWCGDFGSRSSLKSPLRNQPSPKSAPGLEELEKGVWKILNGMKTHSPENHTEPTFRLALYAMSHGLLSAGSSGGYGLSLVSAFLQNYPICSFPDFQKAISAGTPISSREFSLSREALGAYWQNLLPGLPSYETFSAWPDWLTDIFEGWSEVEGLFLGSPADEVFPALKEMFNAHWCLHRMTHFQTHELISAIERWDFSENEYACRDLLIAAFPEAVRFLSPEEQTEIDVGELLLTTADSSPKTAIKMMKLLLDTAEKHLQDPDVAQVLLDEMLYDLCIDASFAPFLLAQLEKDDSLAKQLFQSAYVGFPQECILEACRECGALSLEQRLKKHLVNNSCFHGF